MSSDSNSSLPKDREEWFQQYTAADANHLDLDSDVIQVLESDDLDTNFIEERIRESTTTDPITNGFCVQCQCLLDNWPTLGGSSTRNFDSDPDPDQRGWECSVARSWSTFQLEASTRLGCRFCAFLLQNLKDNELLNTFRKIETRLYLFHVDYAASLSVQNWGTNPIQLLWLNLPGKVCTHCNSGIAPKGGFESAFLPETADCYDEPRDVFNIASDWLSTCSETHELCKSNDDGTLPTRLLSISSGSPRLILTLECTTRPRYATLSHSWGSHDVIKLLSGNLALFMEAIPVERLPQTFKDAIKITRRLGLDYIWIDTLCIVQDDELDWQNESALMSSVYGNSTITIAASSARNSDEGCFLKPQFFNGGLRARITDGGRQRVQDFRGKEVYDLSTFKTHLGSRAWALQEKMLPARTIHLGNRGAFWECRTTIASQYLPDGFPRQLVRTLVRRKAKLVDMWVQIVRLYSAADLTFGKDKLPALSGVARLAWEESGDEYLAGLWRRQLLEQLCWSRGRLTSILKRPTWRAPSWSWASIDGGVAWHTRQEGVLDTEYAQILDASTTKYGIDPFGQVTGGFIRLACSAMAAGTLIQSNAADVPHAGDMGVVRIHEQEFSFRWDCLEDSREDDNKPIHLVPILGGKTGHRTKPEGMDWLTEMLVEGTVLRATGIRNGEFSRIGSFTFYRDNYHHKEDMSGTEQLYGLFLQVLEEHGATTAEAACAEVLSNAEHPSQRYVITIL